MAVATREQVIRAQDVKNVVFDMGNVLMRFDGELFAHDFTDNEEDAQLLYQALFGRTEWALLDSGTISHETIARVARAHLPERLRPNLAECLAHWPEHSHPIEPTNELAQRLHEAGYGVYLLSNASTRIGEQLGHMPAMRVLDGWMASAFERLMKPDPAIYQLFCERFGLDAASCLFVDDKEDNCEGARVAGMQAFHFTSEDGGDAVELGRLLLER